MVLFCMRVFFPLLPKPCISNISNIYNLDANSILAYQTICDHMFSDPKSDHTLHVFKFRIWVIFFSYHMWQLSTYFEDRKVLESTYSIFLIEYNLIDSRQNNIYRPIHNQIRNTTWRSISKSAYSNQAIGLTLFRLFYCNWIHIF